jgi:hypothetical protein
MAEFGPGPTELRMRGRLDLEGRRGPIESGAGHGWGRTKSRESKRTCAEQPYSGTPALEVCRMLRENHAMLHASAHLDCTEQALSPPRQATHAAPLRASTGRMDHC